jgi:hypothetical protein
MENIRTTIPRNITMNRTLTAFEIKPLRNCMFMKNFLKKAKRNQKI